MNIRFFHLFIALLVGFICKAQFPVNAGDTIRLGVAQGINPDFEINIKWKGSNLSSKNARLFSVNFDKSLLLSITESHSEFGGFESTPYLKIQFEDSLGKILSSGKIFESSQLRFQASDISLTVWGNETDGIHARINNSHSVARINYPSFPNGFNAYISAGKNFFIEKYEFKTEDKNKQPDYTLDYLFSTLRNTFDNNHVAGLYTFLDRDNDERFAKPGGFYKLAVIETKNAGIYNIVYLHGAKVGKENWLPGMIKGELKETVFSNNFDITLWIDAHKLDMTEEMSASFSPETGILELFFPLYKTRLRFSRLPLQEYNEDLLH